MRARFTWLVACIAALPLVAAETGTAEQAPTRREKLAMEVGLQPVSTGVGAIPAVAPLSAVVVSVDAASAVSALPCAGTGVSTTSVASAAMPVAIAGVAAASTGTASRVAVPTIAAAGSATGLVSSPERFPAAAPVVALAPRVVAGELSEPELVPASRFDTLYPDVFSTLWAIKVRGKQAEARGEDTEELWRRYWEVFNAAARQGLE